MKKLWAMYKGVEELRKFDPEMPAQTVNLFLLVCMHPGITQKDLAIRLGVSQASISRNTAALSKVHRLNTPGHDLVVATEDPVERRRKVVHLTPKGRRVMEAIEKVLEN